MPETTEIRQRRAPRRSLRTRAQALALATVMGTTALVGAPRTAHADEVKPDGKGIVGGALLGAEVVVFAEALFGVRSGTAYVLGGIGGGIAGGLGGYAIETAVDDGRVPAYLLAGGLVLVIPALVIALDQTRYMPSEGAREDKPVNAPTPDPGKPGGSSVVGAEPAAPPAISPTTPGGGATPGPSAPAGGGTTPAPAPGGGGTQAPVRAPLSLFDVRGGDFRVGVPVPEVRPALSANERRQMGVQNNGSEVRFPVVRVTF